MLGYTVPIFQDGILITVDIMDRQVHAIGKAIRSLFADLVTIVVTTPNAVISS